MKETFFSDFYLVNLKILSTLLTFTECTLIVLDIEIATVILAYLFSVYDLEFFLRT